MSSIEKIENFRAEFCLAVPPKTEGFCHCQIECRNAGRAERIASKGAIVAIRRE